MPRRCPWRAWHDVFYVDLEFLSILHFGTLPSQCSEMLRCTCCIRNLLKAVIVDLPTSQPIISSRTLSSGARSKSNKLPRRLAYDRQAIQPASTENAPKDHEITLGDGDKRRELEVELKYLQDPIKLAQRVHRLLAQNNVQWALKLAQFASKDRSCTVSWNHIINHEMKQGRTTSALKIYNDVRILCWLWPSLTS